jgi:hypothetical protein
MPPPPDSHFGFFVRALAQLGTAFAPVAGSACRWATFFACASLTKKPVAVILRGLAIRSSMNR